MYKETTGYVLLLSFFVSLFCIAFISFPPLSLSHVLLEIEWLLTQVNDGEISGLPGSQEGNKSNEKAGRT